MTPRNTERLLLSGPAGTIDTALAVPVAPPRGVALVAHPHPLQGGTMDNKVVQTLAKALFAMGYVAARFNFRGVGESAGTFDDGNGETEDALAVLAQVRAQFGIQLPVALAGFSFGSFVQMRVAQQVVPEGIILVGAAARRFSRSPVPAPTIVVHGEQDEIVPLSDVLDWARPLQLPVVVFPGCGHFFHGRLTQLAQIVTSLWPQRAPSDPAM